MGNGPAPPPGLHPQDLACRHPAKFQVTCRPGGRGLGAPPPQRSPIIVRDGNAVKQENGRPSPPLTRRDASHIVRRKRRGIEDLRGSMLRRSSILSGKNTPFCSLTRGKPRGMDSRTDSRRLRQRCRGGYSYGARRQTGHDGAADERV